MDTHAVRVVLLFTELKHPNIVELLEVFTEGSAIYLVFEFLPKDLRRFLDIAGSLRTDTIKARRVS
jgi:serine/threonine protein kinase